MRRFQSGQRVARVARLAAGAAVIALAVIISLGLAFSTGAFAQAGTSHQFENSSRGFSFGSFIQSLETRAQSLAETPSQFLRVRGPVLRDNAAKCGNDQNLPQGGNDADLDVIGPGDCVVGAGEYHYHNVNIFDGGTLKFVDQGSGKNIDFWAESILVENRGTIKAGDPTPTGAFGANHKPGDPGAVLTIHLYGQNQGLHGVGITCKSDAEDRCGVPAEIWNNTTTIANPESDLPGGVKDYFYKYHPMPFDDGKDENGHVGYFGYKVLAVSYGGTLELYGAKGATYGVNLPPSSSGTSWGRLNGTLAKDAKSLVVDRVVDWQPGDQIIVTTSDYMPDHSEQLTICKATPGTNSTAIEFTLSDGKSTCDDPEHPRAGVTWIHNGSTYDLTTHKGISQVALKFNSVDTRAAVALLTRSIRIVSAGNADNQPFPAADPLNPYYFGADTVFRQGFKKVQVQGVEFDDMGQGGRLGHYPVHFHMARKTPEDTFVDDCSVNRSMTRWYTIHATDGVTLARDVGYASIGHGYYIEDGTEINNRLYSDIGILARAAINNAENPRLVPGIFAAPDNPGFEMFPAHSDYDHPAIFWIMNGWNDLEYNMAVGAEACGACYWFVPGGNSGPSRFEKWSSYAALQQGWRTEDPKTKKQLPDSWIQRAGSTPIKEFLGNTCSSAMNSLETVGNTTACLGIGPFGATGDAYVPIVNNELAPPVSADEAQCKTNPNWQVCADDYYPKVSGGGYRIATRCDGDKDCAKIPLCAQRGPDEKNCMVNVIDGYTTSFNWAQKNFAAVWLRSNWFYLLNSALTDVQDAALTMVSGGDYTNSSAPIGYWALSRKDVFVGSTQPGNPWASTVGPFNSSTGLNCQRTSGSPAIPPGNYCLSKNDAVSFPMDGFGINQRFFNIYDGPTYEENNAFLDIKATDLKCKVNQCTPGASMFFNANTAGIPQDSSGECYLPDAAIAWKQPNGFYYPPAFHSNNLYFDNVDIRHYVIEPSFTPRTKKNDPLFKTDPAEAQRRYCTSNPAMFTGFTDIDRQTELDDDDGSLTGLIGTVSVNQDPFFSAPIAAPQCKSDIDLAVPTVPKGPPGTATTSPYDYVSTVVFPDCFANGKNVCPPKSQDFPKGEDWQWSQDCANENCYGVPLYRQLLTGTETAAGAKPLIHMMGESFYQRNSLTVNNSSYYIDTTVGKALQQAALTNPTKNITVFEGDHKYYFFLLFAKSEPGHTTKQTYTMFVGKDEPQSFALKNVDLVRANIASQQIGFEKGPWLPEWTRDYNPKTGLLTVTMDFSAPTIKNAFRNVKEEICKPLSFCKWKEEKGQGQCAGNVHPIDYGDYLTADEVNAACKWSVKDAVCPTGGCFGFSVKFPGNFSASDDPNFNAQPTQSCFQTKDWNNPFNFATNAGSCNNPPVIPPNFCS